MIQNNQGSLSSIKLLLEKKPNTQILIDKGCI